MKKILSAILATALCVSFSLTSCKKESAETSVEQDVIEEVEVAEVPAITAEDADKAPFSTIIGASVSDRGIISTLANIVEYGSTYTAFEIDKDKAQVWAKNDGAALDFDFAAIGDIDAYVTNDAFVVSSDAILGGSYGFTLANFKENFENAKFWETLGVTVEDFYATIETQLGMSIDEIIALSEDFINACTEFEKKYSAEAFLEILDSVKHTVEQKEVELPSGKIDAIVIDCDIDYQFVEKLMTAYIDMIKENPTNSYVEMLYSMMGMDVTFDMVIDTYEYMLSDTEDFFDEYIKAIDFATYINADTSKVAYLELKADVFVNAAEEIGTAVLTIDFTNPEKVVLNIIVIEDGEEPHNESITFTEKLSADEYVISIEHESNNDKTELFSFEVDRKANRFVLTAAGAKLEGEAKLTENSIEISPDGAPLSLFAKLTDKEIEIKGKVDAFPFNFVIRAEDFPAVPEYKNVFDMAAEEFVAIGEKASAFAENFISSNDSDLYGDFYESSVEYPSDPEALKAFAESMYGEEEDYYARVEEGDVLVMGAIINEVTDETLAEIEAEVADITEYADMLLPVLEEEAQANISVLVIEYVTTDGDLIEKYEFR